jgi:hypothetical protein
MSVDVTSESAKKNSAAEGDKREMTAQVPAVDSKPDLDDFGLPIRPAKAMPPVPDKEGGGGKQDKNMASTKSNSTESLEVFEDASEKPEEVAEKVEAPKEPANEDGHAPPSGDRSSANSKAKSKERPSRPTTPEPQDKQRSPSKDAAVRKSVNIASPEKTHHSSAVSEWSHQVVVPQAEHEDAEEEDKWETMPAYAPFDIYDDRGKIIAREQEDSGDEKVQYGTLGGAGKGYTRVQLDDDAESITSMDDNTAYLFKEAGTNVADEDDDLRDAMSQMQATKELLTEGQRIAYVGIVRLAMIEMVKQADDVEKTRGTRKTTEVVVEMLQKWSQKMMVRIYSHMEVESAGWYPISTYSKSLLTSNRTSHD